MSRRFPQEVHDFIRAHASEYAVRDMRERVNAEFGAGFTYTGMKSYYSNHGLHALPRKGRERPESRLTTPEQDAFIREHVGGTGHQAMADLVNARFGTSFTREQMKAYYARNRLNSGLTGRFPAGHEPENKGKKQDEYMTPEQIERTKPTRFQKGHTPHNGGTPVGTVRLRHEHKARGGRPYYWEKVAQPNVWRMKHVLEWERHNGPVPEGCMVTFKNSDPTDWRIGNLMLESRAEHAVMNHVGLRSQIPEFTETGLAIAKVKIAQSRARKRRKA